MAKKQAEGPLTAFLQREKGEPITDILVDGKPDPVATNPLWFDVVRDQMDLPEPDKPE
jgi:hypothetical protein